jgi:DNA-binding NarL/FixJ family response regulator
MIRVVIVDDHAVVRRGLEHLLGTADDVDVVGSASDGAAAIDLTVELTPDVVLMDLSMPNVDGIEATRRITGEVEGVNVIVLTSFADQRKVLDALDAGASGYILKDSSADEVLGAIRLDPEAARVLLESQRSRRPATRLSAREAEVLGLVATGLANKQIARRLGITERTVKAHLTAVYQQLGVTDRTQAALWAREHLPPSEPRSARLEAAELVAAVVVADVVSGRVVVAAGVAPGVAAVVVADVVSGGVVAPTVAARAGGVAPGAVAVVVADVVGRRSGDGGGRGRERPRVVPDVVGGRVVTRASGSALVVGDGPGRYHDLGARVAADRLGRRVGDAAEERDRDRDQDEAQRTLEHGWLLLSGRRARRRGS